MHTAVRQVATSRFFDPDQFQDFALEHREKFGITGEGENACVSTWYVNELVDGFKLQLGDAYEAHRQEQIDLQAQERSMRR
jgi:hypothetical protein